MAPDLGALPSALWCWGSSNSTPVVDVPEPYMYMYMYMYIYISVHVNITKTCKQPRLCHDTCGFLAEVGYQVAGLVGVLTKKSVSNRLSVGELWFRAHIESRSKHRE